MCIVAGAPFAFVLALLVLDGMKRGALYGSDSEKLVRGVHVAFSCLGHDHFVACGTVAEGPRSVGPFALLQYLPAAMLLAAGLTVRQALQGLAWLNLACFVVLGALTVSAGRKLPHRAVWIPVLLTVAVTGPLYFYATAAFGEMLVATTLLAAVTAALHRRPILCLVTVLAATLGKETLAPFVLLLVLIAARAEGDRLLPPGRMIASIGAGVILGVIANTGFNEFRYGTLQNGYYLDPMLRVASYRVRLSFFGAVFVAPNGGIAWFWTASFLLFVFGAVWGLLQLAHHPRDPRQWAPTLVVIGVVAAFAVGLASWFAPFGWGAWGPRLMVPLIPAALLDVAYAGGPGMARALIRCLAAPTLVGVLAVMLAVSAWPEAAAPWTWPVIGSVLVTPDSTCPTYPIVQVNRAENNRCTAHIGWRLHPTILGRSLSRQTTTSELAGSAVAVSTGFLLAASGVAARKESRRHRRPIGKNGAAQTERRAAAYPTELHPDSFGVPH